MESLAVTPDDPVDIVLGDAAKLVRMVAEATGLSDTQAAHCLVAENRRAGSCVWAEMQQKRIPPYRWTDALGEFYGVTSAFVFESVVWNRNAIKRQMRRWISDFFRREFARPVRVLVFGDGPGFDSIFLASLGHRVSYFEVSRKAIQFAASIFRESGFTVEMLANTAEISGGAYDAVVCLDVLEHVPDPVETVGLLAAALGPEGRLVVHAPFWYLAPSVATHLKSNRRFSGDLRRLYRPHGLRPVDAAFFWNPLALARTSGAAKSSVAARLRIFVGGLMLSLGRFWSTPLSLVAKWRVARAQEDWPAMEQLASGGAP